MRKAEFKKKGKYSACEMYSANKNLEFYYKHIKIKAGSSGQFENFSDENLKILVVSP